MERVAQAGSRVIFMSRSERMIDFPFFFGTFSSATTFVGGLTAGAVNSSATKFGGGPSTPGAALGRRYLATCVCSYLAIRSDSTSLEYVGRRRHLLSNQMTKKRTDRESAQQYAMITHTCYSSAI